MFCFGSFWMIELFFVWGSFTFESGVFCNNFHLLKKSITPPQLTFQRFPPKFVERKVSVFLFLLFLEILHSRYHCRLFFRSCLFTHGAMRNILAYLFEFSCYVFTCSKTNLNISWSSKRVSESIIWIVMWCHSLQ